ARSAFVIFECRAIELNCCTKNNATHRVYRTLDADWCWVLPFKLSLRCAHRSGRRKSCGRCARADDALPKIQRSAKDPRHAVTAVTSDCAAALILQASEPFSMQL